MTFKKIIVFPIPPLPYGFSISVLFDNSVEVSIFRNEPSFHQYAERTAIIGFSNEHHASVALEAVQNRKIKIGPYSLTAIPFHDDYSPIKMLPDQCLKRIFLMLPVHEFLNVEKVCKRWKKIASQCPHTRLNIEDFPNFKTAKEYIIKYGSTLRRVDYSIHYPVSLLGKYCKNLDNLIIDYTGVQIIRYQPDVDQRSTWSQFKTLRRLEFVNLPHDYNCDFLKYLPKNITELQFGNMDAESHYISGTSLDMSYLSHLQSLTLIDFEFTDARFDGFKKLKNLKHLCIHNCRYSKMHEKSLSYFGNMEFFSIEGDGEGNEYSCSSIYYNSNNVLTYREDNTCDNSDNSPTLDLSSLKYLWVRDSKSDKLASFAAQGLLCLEHLQCQGSRVVTNNLLCKIIENSPYLKFVNASRCNITKAIVPRLESITMQRTNGVVLKFVVGKDKLRNWKNPCHNSPFLVLADIPKLTISDFSSMEWLSRNYKPLLSLEPPLLDDSSPILSLPNECLYAIFTKLSVEDLLNVEQICQRWESVVLNIWKKQKKLDMRDLFYLENGPKCIERCGEYLKEIYYYKDYDVSLVGEYCPNIEYVVIDFVQKILLDGDNREELTCGKFIPILSKLRKLTGLTLRDVGADFDYDFIDCLPRSMTDIHFFPKGGSRLPNVDIISSFPNLRALTLQNFDFGNSDLFGTLNKLKNLTYLRLGGLRFHRFISPLKLTELEHLSMESISGISETAFITILRNNTNLKYLNLSGYDALSSTILDAVASLKYLKTLCLDEQYDAPLCHRFRGIPSLEYLDYATSDKIEENALTDMIASSPNLKIVWIISPKYDIRKIIDAAERATHNRTNNIPLKICLNRQVESMNITCSSHILPCERLRNEEKLMFKMEYYNEWFVNFWQ